MSYLLYIPNFYVLITKNIIYSAAVKVPSQFYLLSW